MNNYTSRISQAISTANGQVSQSLFQLPPDVHANVKQSLARTSVETVVQGLEINTGNSAVDERLAQVVSAHLTYVRDCVPIQAIVNGGGKATTDIATITQAHASWSTVFARSSALFTLPSSPLFFLEAFRFVSSTFLTLSIRLDVLSNQSVKWPNLTDCTARLAGPVRAAGTDRTALPGRETKRAAVMWLGNDCLRGYFKLNNLKLCETVLKSIREALARNREYQAADGATTTAAMQDDDDTYPLAERVRYRYYLGRIRISQGRIREAFTHLQWSFENCHYDSAVHARRILLHLLPCALVLGIRPTPTLRALIQSRFADLEYLYMPLFQAYARPDIARFDELLTKDRKRKETLRRLGVYLMIREKCPIGMWRGVVKRW